MGGQVFTVRRLDAERVPQLALWAATQSIRRHTTAYGRARPVAAGAFVREELRRVDADRHIRDAILAGELKVLEPPDERLLAKIKADLTPEEFEALRRAVAHDRSCSKA
jgi:CTP:molybdopterin cytidylyltransferase MocA